jgi:hypothetical protein
MMFFLKQVPKSFEYDLKSFAMTFPRKNSKRKRANKRRAHVHCEVDLYKGSDLAGTWLKDLVAMRMKIIEAVYTYIIAEYSAEWI